MVVVGVMMTPEPGDGGGDGGEVVWANHGDIAGVNGRRKSSAASIRRRIGIVKRVGMIYLTSPTASRRTGESELRHQPNRC